MEHDHTTPPPTRRSGRKLAVTVLALGAATATVVFGSFAAWTAQTTNPGSSVASGDLTLSNNKPAAAVFTATDAKPGDTGGSTVAIGNSGTIPLSVTLTQDNIADSGFAGFLHLQIHDDTRDWCYWPLPAATGACASYGAWDGSATLASLAIPNSSGGAQWAAAETHTFSVNWEFVTAATNATKNQTASFDLTWDGAQ